MKFGIREICDVVLRAKNAQKIGNRVFYKNEPVIYFDTLKTSSLENQSTTVYAQGGRGNARLIAWEGERTVTFTMEDALISKEGFSILSGAGLIEATKQEPIIVHKTEITNKVTAISGQNTLDVGYPVNYNGFSIELTNHPYIKEHKKDSDYRKYSDKEDYIYVMLLNDNGEIISEPYIAIESFTTKTEGKSNKIFLIENENLHLYTSDNTPRINNLSKFYDGCSVLVDYYTEVSSDAFQINITPDKFSGNFYLEASTLFKNANGVDMPAEFIIPNCKIQSNFNFTMASSGDPSTFTFTLDAFPDYTRWNQNKKVFAAIQVIEQNEVLSNLERLGTPHNYKSPEDYNPYLMYKKEQEQYLTDEPELPVLNDIFYSIDENGNLYNGAGYKKGNIGLTKYYGTNYNGTDSVDEHIVTGFIPCKAGQTIYLHGFKKGTLKTNSDDQEYYYVDSRIRAGVGFYKDLMIIEDEAPLNNNYLGSITDKNLYLIHGGTAASETRASTYSLNDPLLWNNNNDIVITIEKDQQIYQYRANNPHTALNTNDIKYIRVFFNNTDVSEVAVLVTDTLPAQESGAKLASFEPTRNVNTFTEEENNDDDIDELLAYLEEQENNER